MATSIAKTSVAVGMDASAFKTGAESLKSYFADIGATAGKLIGVLGLYQFGLGGIKKGIEASLGKVVAFEKTQAILEAIGRTAGDSKESVAGLVGTLSTITGRNDEAGKALGDMARKMMSIGFSAAETEKMVDSFYHAAKASPNEIGETYSTLQSLALNLDEFGFVSLKQYKAVAQLGIPIMEAMAAKISEMRGVTVTAEEVAAQLKLAQATGGASGITTQEQLQVLAGLGDSKLVKAQIDAIGNTFAGAMKKSKEEISLMFFEIGKAINAFFGGTKTYVAIFKMITAGVKAAREQIELLGQVFAKNRQWIDDFKHSIDVLVIAFFRVFEVMGEQLVESKKIIGSWFDDLINPAYESATSIKGITTETGAATVKTNYLLETFKGFGEYMTDFSNNFQAIFKVFEVITDSFGNDVYRVTNIWEGMYEIIQTIKTAAQVGFLAIAEIGVNSINGILKVFEDLASFTQKWIDKFSYGLGRIGEAMGLLAKGTADMMVSDDLKRGDPKFNFGRLNGSNMAEARANIQAQAEEERRARLQMYNERKKAADQAKAGMENPDFARNKGAGAQLAAPTLLSAGGAEEYKLIVERNNAKLMKGTDRTNELLEESNGIQREIAAKQFVAPGVTVVPLIARG